MIIITIIVSMTIYLFLIFFTLYFSHIVSENITVLFVYSNFDIILYFILRSTIFCCHSFHYQCSLTDFMAAPSEQNVFVAPWQSSSLVKFISLSLELSLERTRGVLRHCAFCDFLVLINM